MTSRATSRRLTVQEAAGVLGTSVDAVRMRARRGSLRSEKDEYGRVFVWVDPDESETSPRPNGGTDALVEELRDRVRFVERQLEAERQAHAEARRIIGGLVQRIPELEAPQEPPGSSENGAAGSEGSDSPVPVRGAPRRAQSA